MLFTVIFSILSLATVVSMFMLFELYEHWYLYIVGVVALPLVYFVWACIAVVFLFVWSLFLNKKEEVTKFNKFYYFMVRQVCYQLDICSRTKIVVRGEEKIPSGRCLVVSNHVSMFDAIAVIHKFKSQPLICVTKMENENIPICGPFIHKAGFIALDRTNAHKAVKAIKQASDYIINDWASIYICPEGTRSKTNELLPFHGGSFKIAYKANVPTVVCNFTNTDKIHKNFPFRRTVVYLDIIDVIDPSVYKEINTNDLALKCHDMILDFQNKGE